MTAYPTWTPASRPGIIPLHPVSFGVILGRSFTALRQNPKVLLGFALVVQTLSTIVAAAAIVAVGFATFGRLATLEPGTDDFDTVLAGSVAITAVTGIVVSLAQSALGVLVQGVVVSEVAQAVVAEKHTLGMLWRRVKPAAWRLIGYTFAVGAAVLVAVAVFAAAVFALAISVAPAAIILVVVAVPAVVVLSLWLVTKLLLVPSALVLEQAGIGRAIARSWHLTRGRFWATLGIIVIVAVSFGALSQVISVPFSFLSAGLTTIVTPTGDPEPSAFITVIVGAVLTQIVITLIQTIAVIVQSTAGALLYIDARMRHEGLDLDLSSYVERRDRGESDLPDPYRANIGRPAPARWPIPGPGGPYAAPGGFVAPPPYIPPAAVAPSAEPVVPAPAPAPGATPPPPTSATDWTAPGSDRA